MSGGELVLLAVIGVAALGGERLPAAKRALGLTLGRFQRAMNEVRRELNADREPSKARRTRLID